jgi:gliding motility-associated-like protein
LRKTGLVLCFLLSVYSASADHITGGETYYTLTSVNNGIYNYHITVKLFMDCFSNRQLSNPGIIGIFDKATNQLISNYTVALSNQETLNLTDAGPCITNPPPVCYKVGYYEFDASLPASAHGYVIATQVNYRVNGIANLTSGYGNVGATYIGEIPGTSPHPAGPNNNSAKFTGSDMVVMCANNAFSYSFAADDLDGDELYYTFCEAYAGGASGGGGNANPPNPPPYSSVPYAGNFSGGNPLGGQVQIDPKTGLITGIAPDVGTYVITVCVQEIRDGVVIATQHKDLQVKITDCNVAAASIPPAYMLCDNTQTISLLNLSNSPLINSYNWDIYNQKGLHIFSSVSATELYTFADTGTYTVKLVINRNGQCADSSTSIARVYPGFAPGFTFTGICVNKPTVFTDATTSKYGVPNGWRWDFGEASVFNDVSLQKNTSYTYPSQGTRMVQLIVADSKGCIDTLTKPVPILDKPPILLAFRDTLICPPDALKLKAGGTGIFNWSPVVNMTAPTTATPTVSPLTTTKYYVDLDDNGCQNRDSVLVRVVNQVSLDVMQDTIICQGDAIKLHLVSDGLRYDWSPAEQFVNPFVANPVATTISTTLYKVVVHISSCFANGDVKVTTIPYPLSKAGDDKMICFDAPIQLNGITDGKTISWSPAGTLSNPTLLNPIARPKSTTTYVMTAWDDKGCPKPSYDSIKVTVLPDILASAGSDTAAITGQPLQLKASGGERYVWSPSNGLSATNIPNPIATHYSPSDNIKYKVLVYNEAECVDSAFVSMKVFKTLPSIFVPSAFSPNGDGKNDAFRFVAAGMKTVEYFNVYNRWGQMVYSSHSPLPGWDGTIAGKAQAAGIYIWAVRAIDYTGAIYSQKGTMTLVR